ncbi:MAG: ferritin-like domain-containing protein [Calothrix sp. C42_A2020_038]|nr:ferritin-like domain-containing protein [Calothrix sp. C42_A2020_038]
MIKQRFITGSHLPEKEDKLLCWLSSELGTRLGQPRKPCITSNLSIYWGASYFGLDKVKTFQLSNQNQQYEILRLCCSAVIEHVYSIEKACVSYMSKMVLMHETTEEQMLYALFSADEVKHIAQIRNFLPTVQRIEENRLLRFLNSLIDTQNKAVILFILLLLDGWSLSYYRSLAIECREPDLSFILQSFLPDKSRHHATEVMLCHNLPLTLESQSAIVETLSKFLQIMRVEPQYTIVWAIEQIKGDLSPHQKIRIFEELDTETQSATRLKFLRSLMRNPNSGNIVQMLEARGVFQPFSSANYTCKV